VKKVCLVLALLLCCAFSPWMTGCESKGTVTGTVTYKDGSPAAHVGVGAAELYEYRIHSTQTDSAGRYVFEDASPGEWQITVNSEDPSREISLRLNVKGDQQNVLDFTLPY
jgi:hypothetical protein